MVNLSAAGLAAQADDAITSPSAPGLRFQDIAAPLFATLKAGAPVAIGAAVLPRDLDNRFSLDIVTTAGTKVGLTLASRGDELLVQVQADAALAGEERDAVAALAEGYQAAIDGLSMQPPRIKLGGLAQLASGVLASIDLDAQVTLPTVPPATQSLAFHLDQAQRSVALDGPAGRVDLAVRTDTPMPPGTREQQERAIDGYLRQFDQATTRGHGDAALMTMFKDAFADLSRTAASDGPATPAPTRAWLAPQDRAMLTGLADFSATVAQAPRWDNPVRRTEVDGFEYEVAQRTQVGGASRDARAITQSQQARLSAQFHEPLTPGAELAFDYAAESQNYKYSTIEDSATSDVELRYRDGRLLGASLRQSVRQSAHVEQYLLGRLKSEQDTPLARQLVRDLAETLQPYRAEGKDLSQDERAERRAQVLAALGQETLLLGSTVALAARDVRLAEAA
ncbi:hypothetical protein C9I28_18270 [Pseudoduganella armeniaca]|uniref:Uncharacterized protein n=1 Tax=Pseudoduganella armeniaca TaxID=2072590 RepID=A0A2R4CD15_9BURK|nr:hypothetical protein C9I28_18270 [Pseudoduganella armeniaca]